MLVFTGTVTGCKEEISVFLMVDEDLFPIIHFFFGLLPVFVFLPKVWNTSFSVSSKRY